MSSDLTPGSPEWTKKITASKVATILGVNPWQSPYALWCLMKGWADSPPQTMQQARGHYLESGVLAWWRDQHPEVVSVSEQVTVSASDWAAATPDVVAADCHGNEYPVDAKTAASDDDWGAPGTDQAPAYYVAQSLWQMAMMPAAPFAAIAVLGSRLRFAEYVIPRDDALIASITVRCKAFHDSLALDCPPPLDTHPATLEAVRRQHPDIDHDLTAAIDADDARAWLEARADADEADARLRLTQARVLDVMGRARYLTTSGLRVARRQPNKTGVSLVAIAKPHDLEGITA